MGKKIKKKGGRRRRVSTRPAPKDLSSADVGAFIAAYQSILKAFEEEINRQIKRGIYDHMSLVMEEMDIDARLLPQDHVGVAILPCAWFGTVWKNFGPFEALKQNVRARLEDEEVRALFDELTTRPIQAWCTDHQDRFGRQKIHPYYGPDSEKQRPIGAMTFPSGQDRDPDDAVVGIDAAWRGATILAGITSFDADEHDLDFIAEDIVAAGDEDFASEFEIDIVAVVMNPHEEYSPNPYEEYEPHDEWIEEGYAEDRLRRSHSTYLGRVILGFITRTANAWRGLTYLSAVLNEDEEFEAFGRVVERGHKKYYELYRNYAISRGEQDLYAKMTVSWFHDLLWSDVEKNIAHRESLSGDPVAILLLDGALLDAVDVDRFTSIAEVLRKAEALEKTDVAAEVREAFKQYVREQRWVRVRGVNEDGVYQ
ncbi:MAG: hypothetical protein ACNA8W_25700, partial [Bradymonadaceae bacterium]